MNRIKRITISLLACTALLLIAGACSNPEDDNPTVYTDIVSFVSQNADGASFTLQKSGDSPVVTLTSTTRLRAEDFHTGTRIVLQYIPESGVQYESGPVRLYAAMNVQGSEVLEGTAASTSNWKSENLRIFTTERTGTFINIYAEGNYTFSPEFKLYIDSSTIDDEYPEIHIVYADDNPLQSTSHIIYGSFDISSVWNRQTCKGIHFYGPDNTGFFPILKTGTAAIGPNNPDVDLTI